MTAELGKTPKPAWGGNRNFIVPPDIIPVRRVSPVPQKKRTLCRPRPDGEPICRAGDREWFSHDVFADFRNVDYRTACSTSVSMHASCLIGLLVLVAAQPAPTEPIPTRSPLRMPAFVSVIGGGGAGSAPQLTLSSAERRVAPTPKKQTPKIEPPTTAPTVAPEAARVPIAAEELPADEPNPNVADAPSETTEAGVTGGASAAGEATGRGGNGVGAGSGGSGTAGAGSGPGVGMSPGPYRLGDGIEPPRKIKDVPPIYPTNAVASHASGTVLIEAVVGADGKVHQTKVVHSIPLLDEAALTAVRQWEFLPSKLNGVAVAVIVNILVQFAIH